MKCKHKGCDAILTYGCELATKECISCMTGYHPRGIQKGTDIIIEAEDATTPCMLDNPHPEIHGVSISPRIWSEMKNYCDLAPGEISGLFKIDVKDGIAKIIGLALLKQENSGASTLISEETITKFTLGLARKGQSPEMWRGWWHTHHNFGTFWSGKDEENIAQLSKFFGTYLISVELNQAGSIITRIDEKGVRYELDLCMEKVKGYSGQRAKCERRIKKLATNKTYIQPEYMQGVHYYD